MARTRSRASSTGVSSRVTERSSSTSRPKPANHARAVRTAISGECRAAAAKLGLRADVRQTDDETELIRWVHEAADGRIPVVLNPAAFTHYSYALRDAIAQRTAPLIEVHLSNPAARESFRHNSVVAGVADGTIAGFGLMSYRLALEAIAELAGGTEFR